jgi:hypothetical protein
VRTVKLITGLTVLEVPFTGDVHRYVGTCAHPTAVEDLTGNFGGVLHLNEYVHETIVPVSKILRFRKNPDSKDPLAEPIVEVDMYIAYSKEVEELLVVPITEIVEQRKRAEAGLHTMCRLHADLASVLEQIARAGFWKRLKFLFTGRPAVLRADT